MIHPIKLLNLIFVFFTVQVFCQSPGKTVSILYFDNTRGAEKYQWLRKGLADMLITDLAPVSGIKVVEREALEKIMKEQALALSGAIDEKQALQVGKLLNAEKLISGSYIVTGRKIRVDAKITDMESGQIIGSAKEEGKLRSIFDLKAQLTKQLLALLVPSAQSKSSDHETTSFEALQTYYEGITFLDNGQIDQAIKKFAQAQELDPLYLKPQKGLLAAYQFLKDFKKLRQQREILKLYQFADQLRIRLRSKPWQTYADIVKKANYSTMSPQELKAFNEKNAIYAQCNTPAQCTWRLMITLQEIGFKAEQNFNDPKLSNKLYWQVVQIAEKAREEFTNDEFINEILYFEIIALHFLKEFNILKDRSEKFLMKYPDYRMISAVEDFYKLALDSLSGDQKIKEE